MSAIEDLQSAVASETTVIQSAVVLLQTLADRLAAAPDMAAVQEIAAEVQANSAMLADAVAANTPAEPAPA